MSTELKQMDEPKPLVKAQLDKAAARGCSVPGCTCNDGQVFMRSMCHGDYRGVDVSYLKDSGILTISCRVCEQLIAKIKVAEV
jgi:hypothetical protein